MTIIHLCTHPHNDIQSLILGVASSMHPFQPINKFLLIELLSLLLQQQGMSQVRQPMMGAQPPMMSGMAAQPAGGVPMNMMQPVQNPQGVKLDPFGAL